MNKKDLILYFKTKTNTNGNSLHIQINTNTKKYMFWYSHFIDYITISHKDFKILIELLKINKFEEITTIL